MQDMAEMLTEDLLNGESGRVKINHIMTAKLPESVAGTLIGGIGKIEKHDADVKHDDAANEDKPSDEKLEQEVSKAFNRIEEHIDYQTISGYSSAIKDMQSLGIGLDNSPEHQELIELLNSMHGLSKKPALDSIILSSDTREDANRFMLATLGELNLPTVHMCMEENLQGMPLLCVSARDIKASKSTSLRELMTGPGVLVLEDLDAWVSPFGPDGEEFGNNFFAVQLTRGAREAVGLIREAVDNPDIFVIATVANANDIDEFFLNLFGPITVIEIEAPTPEERVEIWNDIAIDHPSLRKINRADLVRLSANMSRYDIYMAVREAIEDAYKQGLRDKAYCEVTKVNLYDKMAAYQPLESKEYEELENAIITDFALNLGNFEELDFLQ
jgi:hypothetical protein